MIRLPTAWQVEQFLITVEFCDDKDLDSGNLGQYGGESLVVKILRKAHPHAQAECLLHELWHAGYDLHFGPESTPDEEEVVRFCTRFMLRLIKDNPAEIQRLLAVFDEEPPDPPVLIGVWS